jgi:hypothetical protein
LYECNSQEDDTEHNRDNQDTSQCGEGVPSFEAKPMKASLLFFWLMRLRHSKFDNYSMKKNPKVILLG